MNYLLTYESFCVLYFLCLCECGIAIAFSDRCTWAICSMLILAQPSHTSVQHFAQVQLPSCISVLSVPLPRGLLTLPTLPFCSHDLVGEQVERETKRKTTISMHMSEYARLIRWLLSLLSTYWGLQSQCFYPLLNPVLIPYP